MKKIEFLTFFHFLDQNLSTTAMTCLMIKKWIFPGILKFFSNFEFLTKNKITFELKKIGTSSLKHFKATIISFKMQQTRRLYLFWFKSCEFLCQNVKICEKF